MNEKEFVKCIQKYRSKMNTKALLEKLFTGLAIGACAGIVLETIALFVPFYYADLHAGLAVCLGVLAAAAVSFARAGSMEQAALLMDSFGFEERIITAYEHLGENGEIIERQRENAMRQLAARKGNIRISVRPEAKRILPAFLLLLGIDKLEVAGIDAQVDGLAALVAEEIGTADRKSVV